jgi:hypothetical protein
MDDKYVEPSASELSFTQVEPQALRNLPFRSNVNESFTEEAVINFSGSKVNKKIGSHLSKKEDIKEMETSLEI